MVPRSTAACQTDTWRRELADAFTRVDALLTSLGLDHDDVPGVAPDHQAFNLLVPRGFAALMKPGDPSDPLLRQVLPLAVEAANVAGYVSDPVEDAAAERTPGLLQKYPGRSLLIATGACAIHCRYCFRRHFPYFKLGSQIERWDAAVAEIARDDTLVEVILSGGDPLMIEDRPLRELLARLNAMPHLRRLRIHSRLPVVLPSRVTDRLCRILSEGRLVPLMIIHANHPRELGQAAWEALARLQSVGVRLLNQSVLLAGVNDDAPTLIALSERLVECGVLPYYLHQLDPVAGAAHFQVSDERARGLVETMRGQTAGYLVPSLVREIPGATSKQRIG